MNKIKASVAGRLQMIQDLLDPTWTDEDDVEHHGEPIITEEQALALLQMESDDSSS